MSKCCYEQLTVQALRMRGEIFGGGGIDLDTFDRLYLNADENGLGEYERKLAKKESISVMVNGKNPKQVQGE